MHYAKLNYSEVFRTRYWDVINYFWIYNSVITFSPNIPKIILEIDTLFKIIIYSQHSDKNALWRYSAEEAHPFEALWSSNQQFLKQVQSCRSWKHGKNTIHTVCSAAEDLNGLIGEVIYECKCRFAIWHLPSAVEFKQLFVKAVVHTWLIRITHLGSAHFGSLLGVKFVKYLHLDY